MSGDNRRSSFSLAEKCGFSALASAGLLLFATPYLALLPLVIFLVLCCTAPFISGFSFFLPLISKAQVGERGVALTFDDGPDPSSTPIILDLLARHRLQTTFFVVGQKAAISPELIKEIVAHGHTIGNHSWNHDYFLMLRSEKKLGENIHKTQKILLQEGVRPCVFRPPTGITGPRLGKVLKREGLVTVTWSCRALDRGNRNIDNLAEKILDKLQPGDIIMLHDLPLANAEQSIYWRKELDQLFEALVRNYKVKPLEEIIQHPVMETVNDVFSNRDSITT